MRVKPDHQPEMELTHIQENQKEKKAIPSLEQGDRFLESTNNITDLHKKFDGKSKLMF